MPFDSAPQALDIQEEDLSFAPGAEGLRRLALLLRREMPTQFHWDFGSFLKPDERRHCGSVGCALGLAQLRWPEFAEIHKRSDSFLGAAWTAFSLPIKRGRDIFGGGAKVYGARHADNVTPVMVADMIDRYLAETANAVR